MGIASGIIGGVVAVALGALAMRSQRSASVTSDGWKRMRPGWLIHLTLFGCIAFVVAVAYFFAIGGSSQADAREENLAALLLLLGFGTAGFFTWWLGYLRKFDWKGSEIRVIRPLGRTISYCFADVIELTEGWDASENKLHMSDGKTLRVTAYMHGFSDFMQDLGDHFEMLSLQSGE